MSARGADKMEWHIQDLNALYDWSICASDVLMEVRKRRFADYVAWKIPFPGTCADDNTANRAIRAFCVERLICKMISISRSTLELDEVFEIARFYCIVSDPNLWSSEVGIIFSSEKWRRLLYRDVITPTYIEKTTQTSQTLFEAFGVLIPSEVSYMHMSHAIDDQEEQISFRGGFHVLWTDHSCPDHSFSIRHRFHPDIGSVAQIP